MRCFLIIEARGVKAVAWVILALGEFVVDLAVAYWIIITTRKTGGLLHGYKPLRTASVSRRWLSLRSSQIAMISLPPL